MSDFNMPGVNSKYGTQKLIEGLVGVEKTKLKKLEEAKTVIQDDKSIWQALNRRMTTVRESARDLFAFNNPFSSKIGTSSEPDALTVTANRNASLGDHKVKVINPATSDKFLSGGLSLDATVPPGEYSFKVGEKDIKVNFKGGKLQAFAEAINQRGNGFLKATVVRATSDTQVIQLETEKVGSKNRIQYNDQAQTLLKNLGMLAANDTTSRSVDFTSQKISPVPGSEKAFKAAEKALNLDPGARVSLPFDPSIKLTKSMVLEAEVTVTTLPEDALTPTPPPGFRVPETGSVTFEGLTVISAPFRVDVPKPDTPVIPPEVKNRQVFAALNGPSRTILPEIAEGEGKQKISIPLGTLTEGLTGLDLTNSNTRKAIKIENIKIYDPTVPGDLKPVNAVAKAGDATLEMDGIRVIRETNAVDDLIPGVVLNLLGPSKDNVKVEVKPDTEAIKNGIINLVGNYNRLLTDILVLTSQKGNTAIVSEASYLSEEEKKTALKNLGRFQGDLTLNQLKNSLQRTFMNAYATGDPEGMSLLAQVGISTNSAGISGGTPQASRLRGYLELDEPKLETAIKTKLEYLKNLFGRDASGDLVVDSGAAFSVDETLKPFVQIGGLVASKLSTYDTQVDRKDKEIKNFQDYLVRYEADLKRKYGAMESTLNSMEKNSRGIEDLGRNQGN